MASRAEIIRDATARGRQQWEDYLSLQNEQIFSSFRDYALRTGDVLGRAEREGKVPLTKLEPLNRYVKESIPPFRKSISGSLQRGISNSVDWGFKTQILALDAAGIANKLIQLGTSFIGKDGQVVRWDAAKETFLQSAWSRMNTDAVNAVMAWKPGGLAFSDRVWEITWQTQKNLLQAIQTGVMQGTSAAEISRQIRNMLALPDTFRGDVLKDFHPGVGVYKSAYKNALRLARTELNRAFIEGTYRYAKQKTWIIGYIWRTGAAVPCEEVCAPNRDKFFDKATPPDLPAHPHCLCFPQPVLEGDPLPGQPGFVRGLGPDGKPVGPAA